MDAFSWVLTISQVVVMVYVGYFLSRKMKQYEPETYQKNLRSSKLILGVFFACFIAINVYFFLL